MLPVQQKNQFRLPVFEDNFTGNLKFKIRSGSTQKCNFNNFINREKNITDLTILSGKKIEN